MSEFKPFEKSFEIRFNEIDWNWQMTPVSLFNFMQETAIAHSTSVGLSPLAIAERGVGWFLTKFCMRIERYPQWGEPVRLQTWPSRLQGLWAIREFRALDAYGASTALATAQWVLIDMNRRRPIRLPEWITSRYPVGPNRALEYGFPDIDPLGDETNARNFHVRISDLDMNRHANSASYIDWCLESAPEEILARCRLAEFEINFKREARQGESLRAVSLTPPQSSNAGTCFIHSMSRESDGSILALARSRWVEKNTAGIASATPAAHQEKTLG